MTIVAPDNQDLPTACVVSFGDASRRVAESLSDHYPIIREAPDDLAALVTAINANRATGAGNVCLPAVVVISDTQHSGEVVELLHRLSEADPTTRPRVWPAFVAGDARALADFDAALDRAGAGLCDVVLTLTGAPGIDAQAAALGAWLHIKMPAPASVLGELPDAQGRICRYVALGSAVVLPSLVVGTESGATVDAVAIAEAVRSDLNSAAALSPTVARTREAAAALGIAATAGDPASVMRADQELNGALVKLIVELPIELADAASDRVVARVTDAVAGGVARGVGVLGGEVPDVEVPDVDALGVDVPGVVLPVSDRADAVSAFVLAASKGGLGKMFGKSRIAAAAQAVAQSATRDIDNLVAATLTTVQLDVEESVARQVEVKYQQLATASATQNRADWNSSLQHARNETAVWPRIATKGILRAWGGSVPAPRHYLVSSASVVAEVCESDDTLAVIDLRDSIGDPNDTGKVKDEAAGERAVVLVAQYGLPLSALL